MPSVRIARGLVTRTSKLPPYVRRPPHHRVHLSAGLAAQVMGFKDRIAHFRERLVVGTKQPNSNRLALRAIRSPTRSAWGGIGINSKVRMLRPPMTAPYHCAPADAARWDAASWPRSFASICRAGFPAKSLVGEVKLNA
jgi:hypothetical protein